MRRSLKEITDPLTIEQLLQKASVCHLGLSDNGQPYVVPMNYAYAGTPEHVFSPQALKRVCLIRVDTDDIRAKASNG